MFEEDSKVNFVCKKTFVKKLNQYEKLAVDIEEPRHFEETRFLAKELQKIIVGT